MKTALKLVSNEVFEILEQKNVDVKIVTDILDCFIRHIPSEKQQHEQTAIHITNVLMDALDNPKGGKFSGEDEFNKYWQNKYVSTNKETLK